MFILNLTYLKSMEEVEKVLPRHIAYLDKHYALGDFICSGRKAPRTGGIILCMAQSREELDAIMREDPFYQEKIAEYEAIEFMPTKYATNFQSFVS